MAFAVVVDPRPWRGRIEDLAEVIDAQLDRLAARTTVVTPGSDLVGALRAGAATVAEDLEKEHARWLLNALIEAGVEAKLSRRARSPRQAPPVAAAPPDIKPPPPTSPERPSSRGQTPRPPLPRVTLMDGWPRSLTSRDKTGTADSARTPPPEEPVSARPHETEAGPATVLGWGDVIRRPVHDDPRGSHQGVEPPSHEAPAVASFGLASDVSTEWPNLAEAEPEPIHTADAAEPIPPEPQPPAPPDIPKPLPGRPIPIEELMPAPWLATLLSILAPGGGQVYLGQSQDARSYAMTAPLIAPWIQSVRLANRDAHLICSGRRPAKTRPQPIKAGLFVLSLWAATAAIVIGAVLLYNLLTRPTAGPGDPDAATVAPAVAPVTRADAEPTALDSSEAETDARASTQAGALVSEVEQRRQQARARRLTVEADAACDALDYRRCASLAEQARQLDPNLTEAARLFHRATVALEAEPEDDCADSANQDGCP